MPATRESDTGRADQLRPERHTSAEIYRKLVGSPKPANRIDDPARAEAMAHGTKHLVEKTPSPGVNERIEGVVNSLQADRLAESIGEQYDKTASGEVAVYDVNDPITAEAMAHAAREKMNEALRSQVRMDAMRSRRAEDQMLAEAGTPRYEGSVGVSPDGSTTVGDLILEEREVVARKRAEADILAEDVRNGDVHEDSHAPKVDEHLSARDKAMADGSAELRARAADYRARGETSLADTYGQDAQRRAEAHGLAHDMLRDAGLAESINVKGHTRRQDERQATVELMAKVGLHHLKRAEAAESKGDSKSAVKHRAKANARMGQAAYMADFGLDASRMVKKHRWEIWK